MKEWLTFAAVTMSPSDIGVEAVNADSNTLNSILNVAYFWAGIIAVLVIVIAGFIFITSNGDSQRVTRAKQAILGAVVGLVAILMAYVITGFVLRGVTGESSGGSNGSNSSKESGDTKNKDKPKGVGGGGIF